MIGKLHIGLGDIPGTVREAVRATLRRAGLRIVTHPTGRKLSADELEAVLRAIGRDTTQQLMAHDTNPENAK